VTTAKLSVQYSRARISAQTTSLRHIVFITTFFLWLAFCPQIYSRPYIIKPGDSLQRIAQRELGSASRWQELARLNQLPPPYSIRIGQTIQLPDNQGVTHATPSANKPPAPTAPNPPLFVTNLPPQVPRGNALPTNATQPVVTSIPTLESDEPSAKSFPWSLSLALLLGTFFYALNLRIACWFSNVEATYGRCLKLAIYLDLLGALCLVVAILLFAAGIILGISHQIEPWSIAATIAVLPLALVTWFFLSMVVIKKTLDCKWRNVVTLLIMSWFVSCATGIIIFVSTASYAPLAKLLSNLSKP
jgi:LysM repeat protein